MKEDFTDSVDYYEGSALFRAVAEIERPRRERDAYKDAATARDRNEDELRRELDKARGLLTAWADAHAVTQKLIKETMAFLASDRESDINGEER